MMENISGSSHLALKLDLSKAFDRVELSFLESIMLAMKFSSNLVSLIMRCIRSFHFLVLVNGFPPRVFHPPEGSVRVTHSLLTCSLCVLNFFFHDSLGEKASYFLKLTF